MSAYADSFQADGGNGLVALVVPDVAGGADIVGGGQFLGAAELVGRDVDRPIHAVLGHRAFGCVAVCIVHRPEIKHIAFLFLFDGGLPVAGTAIGVDVTALAVLGVEVLVGVVILSVGTLDCDFHARTAIGIRQHVFDRGVFALGECRVRRVVMAGQAGFRGNAVEVARLGHIGILQAETRPTSVGSIRVVGRRRIDVDVAIHALHLSVCGLFVGFDVHINRNRFLSHDHADVFDAVAEQALFAGSIGDRSLSRRGRNRSGWDGGGRRGRLSASGKRHRQKQEASKNYREPRQEIFRFHLFSFSLLIDGYDKRSVCNVFSKRTSCARMISNVLPCLL